MRVALATQLLHLQVRSDAFRIIDYTANDICNLLVPKNQVPLLVWDEFFISHVAILHPTPPLSLSLSLSVSLSLSLSLAL
jgi:hypothetical protein